MYDNTSERIILNTEIRKLYEQAIEGDDVRIAEILEIFNSSDDVTGGEYLGGNGKTGNITAYHDDAHLRACHCAQPEYYTVKGKDKGDTPHGEKDSNIEYLESAILSYSVKEHQSSIEINGNYNVRQLARWKRGYNPELAEKARIDQHRKLLCLRATDEKKAKVCNPKRIEEKRLKRLARLQARHG